MLGVGGGETRGGVMRGNHTIVMSVLYTYVSTRTLLLMSAYEQMGGLVVSSSVDYGQETRVWCP